MMEREKWILLMDSALNVLKKFGILTKIYGNNDERTKNDFRKE
jgi:hypothetical protein